MEKQPTASLIQYFEELTDPRTGDAKTHILLEILIIAILELPKGIPSHDTFGCFFAKIKPEEFQKRFMEWVRAVETLTAGQVIALDGKKLRRSQDQ